MQLSEQPYNYLPTPLICSQILVIYSQKIIFGFEIDQIVEVATKDALTANLPMNIINFPFEKNSNCNAQYLLSLQLAPEYLFLIDDIYDSFTINKPLVLTGQGNINIPAELIKCFTLYGKELLPILNPHQIIKTIDN